ncbi:Hypothetical protein PENO1_050450 [Penicillium occitanis (nom. inval.)]|nr:hypothetical protein PENOC_058940 [Penicillium occitanis (nom. inval.)]PCG99959.1 Hypothetical protein PENO1_050450 [Penicillium occitanis (nom. inval.)]
MPKDLVVRIKKTPVMSPPLPSRLMASSDLVASGTEEGSIRIWEVNGSDDTPTEHNKQRVISVVFGPNDTVASCSNDQMIYTRKPDGSDLQSYQDTTPVFSVAFPPAGILASCEGDWLVKIWNPESGDAPLLLQGHGTSVDSVAFLSDDQLVSDSEDASGQI